MIFTRSGPYHELSDCGRYSVAAFKADGKFMFQAFRITPKAPGQVFYTHADAQFCRNACIADSEGKFPYQHEHGDCCGGGG